MQTPPLRQPHLEDLSDGALVHAIGQGQHEALAEAYERHGRDVYRVAYGLLRRTHPAEDVTQEVFVRLWNDSGRFDVARGTLRGFLQLDAHGRSVDLIRAEQARANREEREGALAMASRAPLSLEEEVMKGIASGRVPSALEQLKTGERTAIALAFFEGHSYRDVARLLDLPEGTVKSRIRSGLTKLKSILGSEATAL